MKNSTDYLTKEEMAWKKVIFALLRIEK